MTINEEYTMTGTKKSAGKIFSIVVTVALIFLMAAAIIPGVKGASAVNLGSAGNFAILAKSGITTTGTTKITGNIGVSPIAATSMTGFGLIMDASNQFSRSSLVTGGVYAANYAPPTPATMTAAVSAMEAAYTSAAGQAPDATELYAGNLGGKTLAPGVYKWSTGVLIPASTALTLDGQGNGGAVWIFQIAGDLTMNSASQVVLINGAKAENVYWQIAGGTGVTLGSGAHAEGNILAQKAITMNSGASLNGRALAQTAVTLIANTITAPTSTTAPTAAPTTAAQTTTALPGQTTTTSPGQTTTTSPGQTVTPTTARTGPISTTIKLDVGGGSGVYRVEVTGPENTGLIVTGTVTSPPGQGIGQPSGTVYQYIDLAPAQYTPIDRAVISFTVPVSWLNSNDISPQNVVLQRREGQSWLSLPTTLVKTEGGQVYFTAVSPGLGPFTITGQYTSAAGTVRTAAPASLSPTIVSTVAQPAQPTQLPTTKSPVPAWVPVTAVTGALLIMVVLSGRSGKNS